MARCSNSICETARSTRASFSTLAILAACLDECRRALWCMHAPSPSPHYGAHAVMPARLLAPSSWNRGRDACIVFRLVRKCIHHASTVG